jgi:hypothetical protein
MSNAATLERERKRIENSGRRASQYKADRHEYNVVYQAEHHDELLLRAKEYYRNKVRGCGNRKTPTLMTVILDKSDPQYAYQAGAQLFHGDIVAQVRQGWIAAGSTFADQAGARWQAVGGKLVRA